MNYFEFYEMKEGIDIDQSKLKKKFYAYSKEFHPDFYTLETEEKKAEALQKSSINNEAYKTLKSETKRIKYLLDLHHILDEEGKNQVPQSFLMEMMDTNEIIMELEFDFDESELKKAIELTDGLEQDLVSELELLKKIEEKSVMMEKLKDYYLKNQYLLRIKENLSKFATSKNK